MVLNKEGCEEYCLPKVLFKNWCAFCYDVTMICWFVVYWLLMPGVSCYLIEDLSLLSARTRLVYFPLACFKKSIIFAAFFAVGCSNVFCESFSRIHTFPETEALRKPATTNYEILRSFKTLTTLYRRDAANFYKISKKLGSIFIHVQSSE